VDAPTQLPPTEMAFSARFSPGGSSKSPPTQSATNNSFNALSDMPLDFNDFSDTGLTQEEIESGNIDFDSMDIDANVVKAELATRRSTRGKATRSEPEAKGPESVASLLKSVLQQTAGLSNFMSRTAKTNIEIHDSLSSLVDKIANIEIQMSVLRGENEDLKNKMAILNKRIKDLESAPAKPSTPRSYSAVAGAGLPPRPQPTITATNTKTNSGIKKQDPKPAKMLQSLYPRASREIIVAFSNVDTLVTGQMVEDKALESVNNAIANTPINKRLFHGARFSLASNLVLTTGLHETNEDLDDYLDVITKSVEFIGPATASLSVPWTKFLLHGVPTHLDLEVIRRDVEGYCSGAKLGQTPRWLATEADRKDKPASTIVLAFVGSVSFTELGGRTIRVGNRSCNLTRYISFSAQTQCLNCQGFGHPKEFCNTNPVCAVCAGDHLTSKHECPQKSCQGGYRCMHSTMKCANCKGPHRASNRNFPERVKRTQEFREMVRLRKTRTTPLN
jgi:hypothetical protein